MPDLGIKRVYEPAAKSDGTRVLVDRLWPRGLTKAKAAVDVWMKDIAPTPDLRKWFDHDPARFAPFKTRYMAELKKNKDAVQALHDLAAKHHVTLVYGAKDPQINHAVILKQFLEKQ